MKKIKINEKQLSIINSIPSFDNIFRLYETLEKNDKKVMLEGLIKTYSPEKTAMYLSNYFGGDAVKTRIVNSNGIELIIANIPNNAEYEKKCIEIMDNLCGYTMSRKGVSNDGDEVELVFEPKFQKNINDEMAQHEMLIHVSPSYNREKILKNGFCPKFKNEIFNYKDRIYFYSSKNQPQTLLNMSLNIAYFKDNERNDHVFDFYTVNPRKIDKDIEFHRDGMSDGYAYWTYDNVPSDCIIDIQRMKCNGDYSTWSIIN